LPEQSTEFPTRRRPPSLVDCIRTIKQLERLKDLIRHQHRWAHQTPRRSLEVLGIESSSQLRTEINKLLPIARRAAFKAQVSTQVVTQERQRPFVDGKYKDTTYDLFVNYDRVLEKDGPSAGWFDLVLDSLDQAIGWYEDRRRRLLLQLFNPLRLIAHLLRVPVTVLEYMGFDATGSFGQQALSVTIQIIWTLLLLALASLGLKPSILDPISKAIAR
jgi:hypothetical protein